MMWQFFFVLLLCNDATIVASATSPWSKYVQSPSSRYIKPQSVYRTTGNVLASNRHIPTDSFRLTGPNATLTYDFGKQIAGYPTFQFGASNCPACSTLALPGFTCTTLCAGLGIAYSEWSDAVGPESDHQTSVGHTDGTLFIPISPGQTYEIPTQYARGSFRYLTISTSATASPLFSVEVSLLHVYYLASPNLAESQLQQYSGYFYSSDDLLNRVWYAGAYTNQLCTIAANSSVQHTHAVQPVGWSNDGTADGLTGNDVYLADGAKRDRNPWAGDLEVSLKSALVTSNYDNLVSVRNVLREIIVLQDPISKFFPYAGSPLGDLLQLFGSVIGIAAYGSDTYHLWTISNFADYVLNSDDRAFGGQYFSQILTGLQATYQYVDNDDNLYNGTRNADWGRVGQGGKSSSLNSVYYHALLQTAKVARYLSSANSTTASDLESRAAKVKTAVNAQLWDRRANLFWDNTTLAGHRIHPTDGNTFAINFGIATPSQSLLIAKNLAMRLNKFGASAPELPGGLSPFISGQIVRAHFLATPGDASRALQLIRVQWGYMLQKFGGSTLIEGYGADGSRNYPFYAGDSSFVSAAHAWSSGPSYSLVAYLVGMRASSFDVASSEGAWAFQPRACHSGVSSAQGGFRTATGQFEASWTIAENGCTFSATLSTPKTVNGTVYIPTFCKYSCIKLNGKQAIAKKTADLNYYVIRNVTGGQYKIEAS